MQLQKHQGRSKSKLFSHIPDPDHITGISLLRSSDPSIFIKNESVLIYFNFNSQKIKKMIKNGPNLSELCKLKTRDFLCIPGFYFESYMQSENSKITKVS